MRWYLVALFGVPVATTLFAVAIYGAEGFASPSVLLSVLTLLALQLILLQAAEEIGWTAASSRIGCETGTAH